PDSFSDGGRFSELDAALFQTEKMITEGADIIDIGGESTKPGADFVSADEEKSRVIPVIRAIKDRFDIPISLDTYKAEVAAEGIKNGVDVINDIWGLRYDKKMAQVIAENPDIACILCANARANAAMELPIESAKRIDVAIQLLRESVIIAEHAGITKDRIILDPAIGFGWGFEADLQILNGLDRLNAMLYPVMLAASRKSVIGAVLGDGAADRLEGTLALTAIGVMKGCSFIRVHDVKENLRAAKMALAVRESGL
ncbi:MAG: dihydropteroate synthase, partial [Lachnospiraceae bacterium]|nr:dihydropteroate synthase [Lachnospiraceae bacterium]